MGFFGTSQDDTITEEVETATTEKNVEEDWSIIMNICDKAGKSTEDAKSYLKAIVKRLTNQDPHIGVKAVTLLDACVKNSGKKFHIELASRDFENEFMKLMNKGHPTVAKKLRESLKKWSENEFKLDGQLSVIPCLYTKLKNEGYDFSNIEPLSKKPGPQIKDPNFVESQEEEDQILKAIELSLKDSPKAAVSSTSNITSSIYPSVNTSSSSGLSNSASTNESRKVRALYDFEAAEDNELTFNSGEIIVVTDDSDPNWWKGSNHRGEGLFPANFVTADLSVEPEKFLYEKAKKMVQFKESTEVKVVKDEPVEVEINEEKIDRLLHLLHEADPTNPEKDTEEMLKLENEVNNMGPLIDAELERVDRKHAQLTQLSSDLVEALSLYHTLMREPQFPIVNKLPYGYLPASQPMPFSNTIRPGMPPPGMQRTVAGQPNFPFHSQHSLPGHPGLHSHPNNPGQASYPDNAVGPNHPGLPVSQLPSQVAHHVPDAPNTQSNHPYQISSVPMDAANRTQIGIQMMPSMPPMQELDRRQHEQQQQPQGMPHYAVGQGIPNFGLPPGMIQPQFAPSSRVAHTQIPNGAHVPGNPPHFGSSTHISQ